MVLGGLWHGAAWTFVAWGTLHGAYLVVNHAWRALRERIGLGTVRGLEPLAVAVTFLAVVLAWVPFRAADFDAAWLMYQGMAGLSGSDWQEVQSSLFRFLGGSPSAPELSEGIWLGLGLVTVFALPNAQQYVNAAMDAPSGEKTGPRGRALAGGLSVGVLFFIAIKTIALVPNSPFIYFQF